MKQINPFSTEGDVSTPLEKLGFQCHISKFTSSPFILEKTIQNCPGQNVFQPKLLNLVFGLKCL